MRPRHARGKSWTGNRHTQGRPRSKACGNTDRLARRKHARSRKTVRKGESWLGIARTSSPPGRCDNEGLIGQKEAGAPSIQHQLKSTYTRHHAPKTIHCILTGVLLRSAKSTKARESPSPARSKAGRTELGPYSAQADVLHRPCT